MTVSRSFPEPSAAGPRPAVAGEVLLDVFPDGSEVEGGAPFNVAWHLRGLGADPLLISRVGRDPRGDRILAAMESWGLDRSGVQRDRERPTGTVRVVEDDAGPRYEIPPGQAWDALESGPAERAAKAAGVGILYRGTLGARTPGARTALSWLQAALRVPRFVDVNLRAPWWDPARVRDAVRGAAWVQVNAGELHLLEDGFGEVRHLEIRALRPAARAFRDRHRIGTLVVTRGAEGALLLDDDGEVEAAAPRPDPHVDTVGAGDAFAAVALLGRTRGWDPATVVRRAAAFASRTCSFRGATTADPRPYLEARRTWEVPGAS